MESIVRIEDVTFEYKKDEESEAVKAVDQVNLQIEKGSFTAIIGRNGSGKSTLAKNINGLLLPTAGAIYVKGLDTAQDENIWEIRQVAGMVFQNPDNQLVSSVVEDDVAFGPENLGVEPAEIRRRVDESLRAVGMYQHRKKGPHLLSGGQKQRVSIAGVVAMKPECIILDEPTAMLDPKGRAEVMQIIEQLHQEGITILLITHFMEEAAKADRVVIMSQGQVALDGSPRTVFAQVEELRALSLNVPPAVELAFRLRQRGVPIPEDIIDQEALGDCLLELAQTGGLAAATLKPAANSVFQAAAEAKAEAGAERSSQRPVQLAVKALSHVYSPNLPYETKALAEISFAVHQGEFIGIIGHTGSGKSTLIQHLNGLLKATAGSIFIDGVDITEKNVKMRGIRQQIGLVFQYPEYQLFEETVAKDVAFGPLNLGLSQEETEARVRRALKLVDLDYDTIAGRSPFALSGGQKRRAAIAGVIAMEPKVLILDEPTAGLDPKAHHKILKLIRNIREEQGITILLVSHNMGDIARLSDRVLVLDKGRLVMNGTPAEVFAEAEALTAMGLGLPPATELMHGLKARGADVSADCLSLAQAEQQIINWIGNGQK